ncbi:MAG TPA: hypothetical protein VGG64_03750 [Pirellulales bacterium]
MLLVGMRHGNIGLTMNVYTNPKLLDVHAALDALPALPLSGPSPQEQLATGTDDRIERPVAPRAGERSKSWSTAVKMTDNRQERDESLRADASSYSVKQNNPLTIAVNGLQEERANGLEPSTSSLGKRTASLGVSAHFLGEYRYFTPTRHYCKASHLLAFALGKTR